MPERFDQMKDGARVPLMLRIATWIPYLWLGLFFAIPFLIVLKVSLSQGAIAMPPYTPVFLRLRSVQ